ncbi:DUF2480 family protein [Tenacibaculum piscium]|uniref:DUF2480 family protein n=1 Tax=Tenacibaculum piscium TaxID=1458515 RepID=UPI001F47DFF9|nr:DUF2480 family protein [Tenacibaculum piscium]
MSEEIINKIANSQLTTIDLEDFYPKGNRVVFDIKDWLYQGIILREKDFREHVKNHNWQQYDGNYIALKCSEDAIIPSWAYLLLTTKLTDFAKKVVVGDLELLETVLFNDIITNLNITEYQDKRLIIKGCSDKPIPQSAYTLLVSKIQPVCKSIMFGEACSTVPLFKKVIKK